MFGRDDEFAAFRAGRRRGERDRKRAGFAGAQNTMAVASRGHEQIWIHRGGFTPRRPKAVEIDRGFPGVFEEEFMGHGRRAISSNRPKVDGRGSELPARGGAGRCRRAEQHEQQKAGADSSQPASPPPRPRHPPSILWRLINRRRSPCAFPPVDGRCLLRASGRGAVASQCREGRLRVALGGEDAEGFLPVLRRDRCRRQRLRRVPLVFSLGRRAFLRCQTTTELTMSSASALTATTTSATDALGATFCPPWVAIGGECTAAGAAVKRPGRDGPGSRAARRRAAASPGR